jgi:hypothetical protein
MKSLVCDVCKKPISGDRIQVIVMDHRAWPKQLIKNTPAQPRFDVSLDLHPSCYIDQFLLTIEGINR